jgi:hypothetical protein
MKKTLTVCLAALLLSLGSGTSNLMGARLQAEDSINTIRRQYLAINKRAGRYKKVKKELSGFSLEGGELVAYLSGPAIVKMVATHYGEMGRTVEEYYYSNGKLIFAFEKVLHYDKPTSGKVIRTIENRYYLNDNQLIRWIDGNGKQVNAAREEFRSKQKELLENSQRFITAAKSKSPTIER